MKYLTAVLYCAVYTLIFQFSKGRQQREKQHVSTGTLSAFSAIVIILLMFFVLAIQWLHSMPVFQLK